MSTASSWRAAIWFMAALLGASAGVGLMPAGLAAAGAAPGPVPVPIVDGVPRFNVGATHSPALLHELSGLPGSGPSHSGLSSGTGPIASSTQMGGIDVASYQHPNGASINWTRVASAGYKFAFIKEAEGNYYVNPYYASDLTQAKAAGLYASGYVFAVPNVSSGVSQADYAVNNGGYAGDGRTLPMVLDIEYDPYVSTDHTNDCYGLSPAKMTAWISAFAGEVRRLTLQPTIIYSTADWWNRCTGSSTALGANPLWVAAYSTGSPPMPAGWANWTYWQYTSTATVPGITAATDASYFNSAMVALLDPGPQSDPPGTAVSVQVNSVNSAAGQTLSYAAAGLPAGLSIGARGLITGIVQAKPGTYPVTVTGARPSGASQSAGFTWTVTAPSGGGPTGQITGYAGKCVDDWQARTGNGNKIGIFSCNGTAAQQWALTGSGQLEIFGKCLDDTAWGGQGTGMELYSCNGGANQRWTHLANGEYVLASNGLCLNDPRYATANATRLIIWACADTSNEIWSGPA
jgi:GH25 family lysozyme M1 (1,4-beta-N-acetylmuramidase)